MEIKEALRSVFQEMILPEFDQIKNEQQKLVKKIVSVDKRLDDINAHLIDQSRRIDDTNKRIDRKESGSMAICFHLSRAKIRDVVND